MEIPRRDAVLNVRMSRDMRTELNQEAQRTESNAAQVARHILREGLDARRQAATPETRRT